MKPQSLKLTTLYKHVNGKDEIKKATILTFATLLLFEFEKLEIYDNQLFRQSLKSSADTFKRQLDLLLKNYYSKPNEDLLHTQAETVNDGCIVVEHSLRIAFDLAKRSNEEQDAFMKDYDELLLKYKLS
jgi:hypothetical protein